MLKFDSLVYKFEQIESEDLLNKYTLNTQLQRRNQA